MRLLTAAALLVFVGWAFAQKIEDLEPCATCDETKCTPPTDCPMGVAKDRCGCCSVCALEQWQRCNTMEEIASFASGRMLSGWYGTCGNNLECLARTDVDEDLLGKENVCFCKKPGRLCASDGNTYSACELEVVIARSKGKIELISYDDCKTEPKIIDAAQSQQVVDGEKTTFWCEIRGYPLPTVSWYFMPSGGGYRSILLPGDSDDISVSLRGATPGRRIISHLQISNFGIKHQGTYQCFVENDFGSDRRNITAVFKSNPDRLQNGSWSDEI